ncbi:MAG: dockerin type I domain-containing protein, partial [Gammaproteobacteria bacterium]|nr:dockerin type I domain-containing protein [Gammaproteobacteria bacterium]
LGAATPAGTDVVVSQVETPTTEGGPPAWMPDTLNAEFTGKTIANESNAPAGLSSAYATAVGRDFYGSPTSIAPAITSIGAFSAGNWLGGGFLQTVPNAGGPAPNASTSRITNHSWVGTASNFDTWVLRRLDWLVETDETIQVVAVDNGDGITANNLGLLASAYNAIAVGRSDGLQLVGSAGVDATYIAGRARPDLVDPSDSTLGTTPRVAAAAALLVETGHANAALSTDPVSASVTNRAGVVVRNAERSEVIKAALMAGADRMTHNTTSPNLAAYRGTPANQADNGLDRRYGAGQLNVRNSYRIIAAGEQGSTEDGNGAATVAARGFDYDPSFGGQGGSNTTATYPLPVQAQPALLTATLAWNLDITGPVSNDFDGTATLRDLNVELIDLANGGALVASSNSALENTENLWLVVPANAQYALRVTRTGSFNWDYALAWQLQPDTDADRAPNELDNCTLVSNASQCDSDGDGFGNRCDADLNNNGATNAQDATLFRAQLGQPSVAPAYNAADLNCNGFVNAQDSTLFRSLLGNPPGPSGLQP